MADLLNNLPVEDLTKENDYLGVIDKAELIKTILENNTDQFNEIKMFVLYGDWGCGKSTLMKYLERKLRTSFNTFFFDTWQFEKDENLPQTLLEFLLNESESLGEKISGDILKFGAKLFRGLGKSVKIKVPLFPNGLSVDFNPAEFVKEFEKEEISFYQAKKNFGIEFKKWESNITEQKPQKYNIIFIDDLDRCEPENVLNLLSAIKLFFTYGEKTIFFFGVDKKAVQQAIQTKYDDLVKSEEYLEKIFDISFSMPEHESILKLVSTYFINERIQYFNDKILNLEIAYFFKALHVTNPRKLKKVLNKYLLLANAKEKLSNENPLSKKYIGEIFTKESNGNYFETILSLYFITMKEFYPESFKTLFDFKLKESIYTKALKDNQTYAGSTEANIIKDKLSEEQCYANLSRVFSEDSTLFSRGSLIKENTDFIISYLFFPINIDGLRENMIDEVDKKNRFYNWIFVSEPKIDYYFLKYFCHNLEFFRSLNNYSNKSISQIYQGIKQIL